MITQVSVNVPLDYQNKQKILEAINYLKNTMKCCCNPANEIEVFQIGHDLQKVKARVDKIRENYILREQLKVIREELGEDNTADTRKNFTKSQVNFRLRKLKRRSKKIERFKSMNSKCSRESSVLSTYIETLLALPWDKKSKDSTDLEECMENSGRRTLRTERCQGTHHGIPCCPQTDNKGKSPILCLVGPPGTGKTSIARL